MRKCEWCKKEIPESKPKKQRFCSPKCYTESTKKRVIKVCKLCKKEFEIPVHNVGIKKGKFCSLECYLRLHSKGTETRKCKTCGISFSVHGCRIKKGGGKYCSDKCKRIGLNKNLERTCLLCGKTFFVPPSRLKYTGAKYCSRQCSGKAHRIKRTQLICEQCGNMFSIPTYRARNGKGRFCSKPCQYKWQSENLTGGKAPLWYGGVSFEPYPVTFNDQFKKRVRERDFYTCAICGKIGKHVHHIDYDKKNTTIENCITLCGSCHSITQGKRKQWINIFRAIMWDKQNDDISSRFVKAPISRP